MAKKYQLNEKDVEKYINIGFCQKSAYKPNEWSKAVKYMQVAIDLNIAKPFDYGRGKGKFTSDLETCAVVRKVKNELFSRQLQAFYGDNADFKMETDTSDFIYSCQSLAYYINTFCTNPTLIWSRKYLAIQQDGVKELILNEINYN